MAHSSPSSHDLRGDSSSHLSGAPASLTRHDSLAAAIEALGAAHGPLLTLHLGLSDECLDGPTLRERALHWARAFHALGVARGDRVVLLLPTSNAFVQGFLGVQLLGAVAVPLACPMTFGAPTRYLEILANVVDDAEPSCIVTTERLRAAMASVTRFTTTRASIVTPAEIEAAHAAPFALPSVAPRELALLQYTSGTTGQPKGVAVSNRALVSNAACIRDALAIDENDIGVSWLPMFHDMGLIGVFVTAICHPYPMHLMSPDSFVMQPRRWLERISRVRGTVSAAPNFAYELCARRGVEPESIRLDSWRAALSGAEPVREGTLDRFAACYATSGFSRDRFMPVYGLAEATLAVTFPPVGAAPKTQHVECESLSPGQRVRASIKASASSVLSVGRPVRGTEVRIANERGSAIEARVVGEICVRGPGLMDGYFRREEATADALRDGWLHTGDLGYVDDGVLFVVGRAKEMIVKSGRNVYPADIESVVEQVAGVLSAAAFGVANAKSGTEDLIVVCESRVRTEALREALAAEVKAELLATTGVRADSVCVWPVSAIPRTTSGKIRHAECAMRWTEGRAS